MCRELVNYNTFCGILKESNRQLEQDVPEILGGKIDSEEKGILKFHF